MSDAEERERSRQDLEIYSVLRAYHRDEGELINQRMSWLLVSQTAMLTAFGFLLPQAFPATDAKATCISVGGATLTAIQPVLLLICLSGLLFSIAILESINAAYNAADSVRRRWSEYVEAKAGESAKTWLPEMGDGFLFRGSTRRFYFLNTQVLPMMFVCIWILVGIVSVFGLPPADCRAFVFQL